MKTKLTFLFLILLSIEIYSQWQLTSGPFRGATKLYPSGNNIFTITWSGIYLSVDKGNHWIAKNSGLKDSTSIRFLLIDKNKIYAGTKGGIYLSTNNGTNWTAINNGLINKDAQSMVIKGDTLYAAIFGSIYSSADDGKNWTELVDDSYLNVSELVVCGNDIFANASGGIYQSKDNCANWTRKDNGIPVPSITTLAASGDTLFAGNASDGGYWSTDKGENWTRFIAADSPEMTSFSAYGNNIFAGTANWLGIRGGLYLTTNNGVDWTNLFSGTTIINAIKIENSVFAGTMHAGVLMSADTGKNWKGLNAGLPYNVKVNSLLKNGNEIYAGTSFGLYKTTNNGKIWEMTGLEADTISALAGNGNKIFAAFDGKCCNQIGPWGGFSNYIYMSQDNGDTWQRAKGVIINVVSLVTSGTNIFAVAAGGVHLSTNNGSSWTTVNTGLPSKTNIYTLTATNGYIFAGTGNGVYLSTNDGASWSSVNKGIPENTNIHTISLNGNQIIAAGDGIFLSDDNGNNWKLINQGLPTNVEISSLTINGNYIFTVASGSVYYSINNGKNWNKAKTGLPSDASVNCIVTNSNYAFAGTDNGTYNQLLSDFPYLTVSSSDLSLADSADSETSFTIYSNVEWTLNNNSIWLTPSVDSGLDSATIKLSASANPTNNPRTDTVTVIAENLAPQMVIVTQTASTTSKIFDTKNLDISLYPMPVLNYLNISNPKLKTQFLIEIYSVEGEKILSSKINENLGQINLSGLSSGFYIVKIKSPEGGILIRKIVKK